MEMNFGDNLRKKRIEKNLSQRELALRISVVESTISNWECGRAKPDNGSLVPLADALEITTDELLCHNSNNQKPEKETVLIFVFGFFLVFLFECFFYFFNVEVNQFVRVYVIGLVLLLCCFWGFYKERKKKC